MKLLKEIASSQTAYTKKLEKIAEKVELWLEQIGEEKRLGLGTIDQILEANGDPYNTADQNNPRFNPRQSGSDTIDFTPDENAPKQIINKDKTPSKIHLIYDPKSGEIGKVIKTSLMSRPPADYIEANAEQVHGALKHLERMNPKLADLLVNGSLSIWIPRNGSFDPNSIQSIKSLGMQNTGSGTSVKNMSPDQLAAAQSAAGKMSTV